MLCKRREVSSDGPMRPLVVSLVLLAGCSSSPTTTGQDESEVAATDGGADAAADAKPDAHELSRIDPCRCAFRWSNGPEGIVCFTRGICEDSVKCVPVTPLTEDPSCRFE